MCSKVDHAFQSCDGRRASRPHRMLVEGLSGDLPCTVISPAAFVKWSSTNDIYEFVHSTKVSHLELLGKRGGVSVKLSKTIAAVVYISPHQLSTFSASSKTLSLLCLGNPSLSCLGMLCPAAVLDVVLKQVSLRSPVRMAESSLCQESRRSRTGNRLLQIGCASRMRLTR
jgi:hypothetical protein